MSQSRLKPKTTADEVAELHSLLIQAHILIKKAAFSGAYKASDQTRLMRLATRVRNEGLVLESPFMGLTNYYSPLSRENDPDIWIEWLKSDWKNEAPRVFECARNEAQRVSDNRAIDEQRAASINRRKARMGVA